ncbi:hypothetical protein N7528_000972 [Penicillium herquei]|nr:hypothetical protein N7528_000972 [Penicillium herquei]
MLPKASHRLVSQANFYRNEKAKEYKGFYSARIADCESLRFDIDQESARALCEAERHINASPRINWAMTLPPLNLPSITESEGPLKTEREEDELRTAAAQRSADLSGTEQQHGTGPLETEVETSQLEFANPSDRALAHERTHDTSNPTHAPVPSLPIDIKPSSHHWTHARNKSSSDSGSACSAEFALGMHVMPSLKNLAIDKQPYQSSASGSRESSNNSGLPSMGLGSLSQFMDTRAHPTSTDSSSNPPFSSDASMDSARKQTDSTPSETTNQPSDIGSSYQVMRVDIPSISIPHGVDVPLAIFISADLLKTHLPLVQSLEQRDDPPKFLYREYTPWSKPIKKDTPVSGEFKSKFSVLPPEADLIIAPSVGIILATAQDLIQLYLPGHGPSDPELRRNSTITSPLRERILRLAPRYKTLHVMVSHPASNFITNPDEPASSGQRLRLDKSTHDSIVSMDEFCRFFKTNITLVHTPAIPEKMAELIIVLTKIGSSRLLPIHMPPTSSSDPDGIGDTSEYVPLASLLHENETRWEMCLRSVGLNPYAARIVLDVLEVGGRVSVSSSFSLGEMEPEAACGLFLNMGFHDRMRHFELLLGEYLIMYVEENLMELYDEEDEDDIDSQLPRRAYSL